MALNSKWPDTLFWGPAAGRSKPENETLGLLIGYKTELTSAPSLDKEKKSVFGFMQDTRIHEANFKLSSLAWSLAIVKENGTSTQ